MALMKFFSAVSETLCGQQAAALEVVQRFDSEIRIDGAGAVSDEQGEVHDFARFAGFDDERDLGARFFGTSRLCTAARARRLGIGA